MQLRKIKQGKIQNKKGQFETKLLAIVLIFIIGVILLFFSRVNKELYVHFEDYLNDTEEYSDSEAIEATQKFIEIENSSIWDWAFLAIFIGIIIQMLLFSFATRINIAFFWIMVIVDIPILIAGVILSNIWQEMAANPEFADTITRFSITNMLLGSYYPVAILTIIFVTLIILFGKPPQP